MDFSLDLLNTFLAVYENRSFTVAAEKLHKTQSSVSAQIALLEDRARLKLFNRSRKPIQLTEAGRLFLQFAEVTVNSAEGLSRSLRELASGVSGEIELGATTSIGTYFLPKIIAGVINEYPKLNITLSTQTRTVICDAVRQSYLDFAVILTDKKPQGLTSKLLKSERLCFIVSRFHPLAREKAVTLKRLQSVPFILGLKDTEYTEMIDKILKRIGVSRYSVRLRMSNFEGWKECLRTGIGVSILPEFSVRREIDTNSLSEVMVENVQLAVNILVVENPRHVLSPSIRLIKERIEHAITSLSA
jgi:DNA-binding transcriptional LysR family regulator